jgi:hypothetical protein
VKAAKPPVNVHAFRHLVVARRMPLLLALALVLASASVAPAQPRQPFDEWLANLLTEAGARL